ncbi:carbohydrate binding domain-containing protein [Streptomyces sp. NPDC050619]|uniref:carbohydrate binding domain-containing protein n=1 Tax=Streptomyces sp. NPDC050619 TaxID=3157214 RepID=UPI0034135386
MAFPDTPLDARFELLVNGVWIPVPTYERDTIVVEHGRPDMASQTDPGSLQITINNRDGRFSPRNPESDLYGQFGRNSRGRLSVPGTLSYLELDGSAANNASTPDHASLDITGDLDLRWEGEADWYAPGAQILIGKWGLPGQRAYHLRVQDGFLYLMASYDGTLSYNGFWVLPSLPRRAALRATVDVDDGAGGRIWRMYWAESLDGPWTQFSDDIVGAPNFTVFSSSAPLSIAPEQLDVIGNPQRYPVTGRCYRAEVRNGINGTIVASPDFTAQTAGTTSFADSAGRTWSLSGTATIRDRADLIVVEVPEWPQSWQPDASDAWVAIEGAGILRRMGQGKKALQSTLRRRIPSYSPLAYWTMEEGKSATQSSSPIAGVPPLSLSPATWAAEGTLPSSNPLPTINSTTATACIMSGRVPAPATSLTSWHVQWLYRIDQGPAIRRTFLRILSTGTVRDWYIQSGTDGTTILGRDVEGATVFSQVIGTGTDLFGQWVRVKFAAVQNGGNVTWTIIWTDVGGDAGQFSTSFAGTVGRPVGVASPPNGYSPDLNGMAIGHISVWPTDTTAAYDRAIDAWTGESAWDRMRRLATEENLPLGSIPGPETTELVGPQTPDTLLTLLQAAADADGGMLLEDQTRPGLVYRERSSMYSQEPKLTLSYSAAPGLAAPLDPVDDDTATRNDRTVVRDGGSEGHAVLEEGPLSVNEPPDGIGLYDDSVTLSLYDDAQAEPIAYWRLHLGTFDGPRYPQVKVLLHKAPNLIPAVLALGEGDLIRITGLPKYVGFGDVDLLVEGIRHEAGLQHWEATFNCSPGQPWHVGVLADGTRGRVDANPGGSTLTTAATATDTQLLVHTPARGALPPLPWITSTDRLSSNPDFETDLTGWTASGATIDRVPTPRPAPFGGDWSLQVTPNGVASLAFAASPATPVIPGTTYYPYGWLRCAATRGVDLNVNWYDSGDGYLSTSTVNHTVTADTWTEYAGSFTAPVGAATARVLPTLASTPPASHILLADVVLLGNGAADAYARDFPYDIRIAGEVARVTANSPAVLDTFGRTVAGGWGTTDTGQAWSVVGTAADYEVTGGWGAMSQPATGIAHIAQVASPGPDVDLYVDVGSSALAAGASRLAGPIVRATGNTDHYMARIEFTVANTIILSLRKRLANVESQLAVYTSALVHTTGSFYRVRIQAEGSTLRAKVWLPSAREPGEWHVTALDTSLTAANNLGLRSFVNTGSTAPNPQLRFKNFDLRTPQRMTVLRSRNNVVKAQAAGSEVRLAQPTVVAL